MLKLSGNALDAAVAGGFMLHVVEPHLDGPGGDLPAIVATAADPVPRVLCGQGPAPARATPEVFAAMGLDHLPGDRRMRTPPFPARWTPGCSCCATTGRCPLATVLEPAIGYSRHGHPLLGARGGDGRAGAGGFFSDSWTTSADLWLRDGQVPRAGEFSPTLSTPTCWSGWSVAATAAGPDVAAQAQAARDASVRASWPRPTRP